MTLLDLVVVAAVLGLLFWLLHFDRRPAHTPPPPVPATAP
jgi:hypothetical protein